MTALPPSAVPGPAEQEAAGPGPAAELGPAEAGLRGAAVIVTGAGSGIGAATARQLGAAGACVLLAGRRAGPLEDTAADVRAAGGRAACLPADLADPASPARVAGACLEHFGQIDGLVNNAATIAHRPLDDWDTGGFDEHVAVNIRAPFFLIQAALPALRVSPLRSVVNISSSSGTLHRVGQSVYGMTKSALDYLTKSLAGELAPDGVRVNTIAPGPIDTPIHATWADDLEEAYRWLGTQVPLGRIGAPAEVARWIVLLLGPSASFITGAVIPVDGGQVIDRE
jgi:NAD(P)-dependent dehydrogenase (short-subunit alcohol dehydrogenase family)